MFLEYFLINKQPISGSKKIEMNQNSFEDKHVKIYIEKPDDSVESELAKISEKDQYRAVFAWGHYLIKRENEPAGVEILEKIWENHLSGSGVNRWEGINYLYYQLCSMIAYREAKNKIKESEEL